MNESREVIEIIRVVQDIYPQGWHDTQRTQRLELLRTIGLEWINHRWAITNRERFDNAEVIIKLLAGG